MSPFASIVFKTCWSLFHRYTALSLKVDFSVCFGLLSGNGLCFRSLKTDLLKKNMLFSVLTSRWAVSVGVFTDTHHSCGAVAKKPPCDKFCCRKKYWKIWARKKWCHHFWLYNAKMLPGVLNLQSQVFYECFQSEKAGRQSKDWCV